MTVMMCVVRRLTAAARRRGGGDCGCSKQDCCSQRRSSRLARRRRCCFSLTRQNSSDLERALFTSVLAFDLSRQFFEVNAQGETHCGNRCSGRTEKQGSDRLNKFSYKRKVLMYYGWRSGAGEGNREKNAMGTHKNKRKTLNKF